MESRVFEGQAYAGYAPQQQQMHSVYPQAAEYCYPPQQQGYGYPPPRQGAHWYPPQQQGYGYPPPRQGGYRYPPQGVVQPQQVNNFGAGWWELIGDNITSDVGGFAASELGIGVGFSEDGEDKDGSDVYPPLQQGGCGYPLLQQGGCGYPPQGVQPQQVNNFEAGLQQGFEAGWELFGDNMTSDVGEFVDEVVDGNADADN